MIPRRWWCKQLQPQASDLQAVKAFPGPAGISAAPRPCYLQWTPSILTWTWPTQQSFKVLPESQFPKWNIYLNEIEPEGEEHFTTLICISALFALASSACYRDSKFGQIIDQSHVKLPMWKSFTFRSFLFFIWQLFQFSPSSFFLGGWGNTRTNSLPLIHPEIKADDPTSILKLDISSLGNSWGLHHFVLFRKCGQQIGLVSKIEDDQYNRLQVCVNYRDTNWSLTM